MVDRVDVRSDRADIRLRVAGLSNLIAELRAGEAVRDNSDQAAGIGAPEEAQGGQGGKRSKGADRLMRSAA